MNKLLKDQQDLQNRLMPCETKYANVGELCGDIRDMSFYLNQEVVELIEEIAGSRDISKPWKEAHNKVYYAPIMDASDKVKSEAIDVLKFALNICLMAGITPDNIDEEFYKVNSNNHKRIDNEY